MLTANFTRWEDPVALVDATAPVVAKPFCYFGLPEEMHSDRGTQFEGELITELCDLLNITKTRTTAYYPQFNGVV